MNLLAVAALKCTPSVAWTSPLLSATRPTRLLRHSTAAFSPEIFDNNNEDIDSAILEEQLAAAILQLHQLRQEKAQIVASALKEAMQESMVDNTFSYTPPTTEVLSPTPPPVSASVLQQLQDDVAADEPSIDEDTSTAEVLVGGGILLALAAALDTKSFHIPPSLQLQLSPQLQELLQHLADDWQRLPDDLLHYLPDSYP